MLQAHFHEQPAKRISALAADGFGETEPPHSLREVMIRDKRCKCQCPDDRDGERRQHMGTGTNGEREQE